MPQAQVRSHAASVRPSPDLSFPFGGPGNASIAAVRSARPTCVYTPMGGGGYGGDHYYATSGSDGSAEWAFGSLRDDTEYEILVTWVANPSNAPDAPFTVFDGTTSGDELATVPVDQTVDPDDHPILGDHWYSLGRYSTDTPDGEGVLTVLLTDDVAATKRVVADAVLLVEARSIVTTTYDIAGRVVERTDPLKNSSLYQYDNLGRLVQQTDAEDGQTKYTYDTLGNRLSLTDPVNNKTTWVYDDLNRVVEETNQLDDTRYFEYNAAGTLVRRIDREDRVRQFEYDYLYRNTAEIWYNSVADADADQNRQNTISFTYDSAGRMLTAEDDFAEYAYSYDRLGRVTNVDNEIVGLTPVVSFAHHPVKPHRHHGREEQKQTSVFGPETSRFQTQQSNITLIGSGRTCSFWTLLVQSSR